ncbi:MAG: DoxX family protein [Saprospiraceae bacterium]|nr:DoxX family protein [Saprospiraceae bacterium]MCB9323362.1 DoxX family protein [Lewinellaceae bacterium]
MKDIADLIGRVFLSFIFLFEAYDSIRYFQSTQEIMTSYGITWRQDLLLSGAIFVLITGGTLILMGYRSSLGALLLLLYWVPVTFIVHSFWNDPSDMVRFQSIQFMKNIAIIGGLLMVLVNGSGRYSIKRLFATSRVPGTR